MPPRTSLRRASASRSGHSAASRRWSAAATAMFWDSFEGREIDGAADIYPYVSRGNYIQNVGQPTPLLTTNELFPSFADLGAATPAANTFLAVSMSPEPQNPYVQQWSLGVQREVLSEHHCRDELHRHQGDEPPDAAEHRASAALRSRESAVGARRASRSRTSWSTSTATSRATRNYHSMNAKLERHTSSLVATVVYTWAKSIDNKSAAAGIGASGFNGWQGLLDNSRPGARSRALGLRRGPPPRRELRV